MTSKKSHWLLALGLTAPPPIAQQLAPTLSDVEAAQESLETLLYRARSLDAALGRVQNAIAEDGIVGCEDAAERQLAARARLLGGVARDTLQSARIQLAELDGMLKQRSVSALLRPEHRDAHSAAMLELDVMLSRWHVAAAWQADEVEPWLTQCPTALADGPGLEVPLPAAGDDPPEGTVVVVRGDGYLCPGGQHVEGVAVLPWPSACLAPTEACGCEPEDVLTAAVLSVGGQP